jgi:O-antigen ligase
MRALRAAEDITGATAIALYYIGRLFVAPAVLLSLAIWTSASVAKLRSVFSFHVGSTEITLSGCVTFALFVGSLGFLWTRRRATWLLLKTQFRPYLLFLGYALLRVVDSPDKGVAVREWLVMAMPIAVGLVAEIALISGLKPTLLEIQILLSPLLIAVPLIILAVMGAVTYDDYGLVSFFGKGAVALYGLPVLSLALSFWRYRKHEEWPRWAAGFCLGLILSTVGRMPSAVAAFVLLPARYLKFDHRLLRNAVITGVLAISAAVVLLQVPAVRYRFLEDKETPVFSQQDEIINTSGRAEIWYLTAMHAAEKPIWGHGTGAAEVFVTEKIPILDHPHNDYLRVYHDFGILGLGLFVAAWWGRVRKHFKLWRALDGNPQLARPQMAAALAALSIVLAFTTDNPLLYVFVQIPIFLLFAIADAQQDEHSGSSRAGEIWPALSRL